VFQGSGSLAGSLLGNAGTNTLDLSGYTVAAATVNLQTSKATPITGTFSNIGNFVGDNTTSILVGPNATTTWIITATNAGAAGSTSFSGFANLTGGTGNDTFSLATGSTITGAISGGTGTNTLDYSGNGTSGVVVDLPLGSATSTGGVANIQNVKGSAVGGDILVGNASANVLTVYQGQNILIGGAGADTLNASPVPGSDLLIAGTTSYDSNLTALGTIMAEWNSTDSYATRVSVISSPTFAYPLIGTGSGQTVFDDSAVDVINGDGGTSNDWFFVHTTGTNKDKINNQGTSQTVTSI
jgi:hypothetical protein